MWIFFVGQGRTRIYVEAYSMYVAPENPRRTLPSGKKTIYRWTLSESALLDPGRFSSQFAQIIDFGSTHTPVRDDFDSVDDR